MTRLNDLQLVLLSAAAQREDGSLLPPPDQVADQTARIRKAIPPLIRQGLVEESPSSDPTRIWREQDGGGFALIITDAGRERIGVSTAQPDTVPQVRLSKTDQVLTLLRRESGASLDELVAATGWLPHSTRAALTGLRKKGHAIIRKKVDDVTRYALVNVTAR